MTMNEDEEPTKQQEIQNSQAWLGDDIDEEETNLDVKCACVCSSLTTNGYEMNKIAVMWIVGTERESFVHLNVIWQNAGARTEST